ncbi:MAG: prolyl oligopeptidase family serine peptidase [Thermoanaerobaculia bacterium]
MDRRAWSGPAIALAFLLTVSATAADGEAPAVWTAPPGAPEAPVEPTELVAHGHTRIDPYYWLRDRDDPRVTAYLEAENRYFERAFAPLASLRDELSSQLLGRHAVTQPVTPFRQAGFLIYGRQPEGRDYPVFYRRRLDGGRHEGPEELMLDVNESAANHSYCRVRLEGLDPTGRILAYIVDTVGNGRYTLRFRDLASGRDLPDRIEGVIGGAVFGTLVFPAVVWAADFSTVFYARQLPDDMRLDSIHRHRLGTGQAEDALVYQEEDPSFWSLVTASSSGKLILLYAIGTDVTEVRALEAARPLEEPRLLFSREGGTQSWVEEHDGELIVRTDDGAEGYRVVRMPLDDPDPALRREVRPGRDGVLIDAMQVLKGHVVLLERREARPEVWIVDLADGSSRRVELAEEASQTRLAFRQDWASGTVRLEYSSLTAPRKLLAVDLADGAVRTETELQEVDGYDPRLYRSERFWATARDGARVPVSLVYRADRSDGNPRPLLLYGYGTYGVTIDPAFDAARLSLLDRGFVYAIAHVRGGQALGRSWYEHGRGPEKIHTMQDFVDAGRALVASGWTAPDRLFALGESAGGATVGAALNMAPDLFRGVVAKVPAVDLVTSMSDPSIPLVTGEYGEWGNPAERDAYFALLAYSPYDNVAPREIPALLVFAGLHDRQVSYWEPAKWVAKLRATATGRPLILLRTDMEAGHFGASSAARRLTDEALVQAFLLRLAGLG